MHTQCVANVKAPQCCALIFRWPIPKTCRSAWLVRLSLLRKWKGDSQESSCHLSLFRAIQGRRRNGFPSSLSIVTRLFRKFLISQFSPRYKKADRSIDTCPRKRARTMRLCLRNCSLSLMISMKGGSRKPAIPSAYVAGPILSDEKPGMTFCSPLGRIWPQEKAQRPFLNASRQAIDFERQAQSHSRSRVCF